MCLIRRLFLAIFIEIIICLIFSNSHIVYATSSSDTLVGYWKLDETTQGSNASDASGDGNTGTPHGTGGGPSPSATVPSTAFPNAYSASFNGSDQYVEIANSSGLNPTSAVTISAWINLAATDANFHTIAGKWYTGVNQQYLIQINNNGKLGFWTGDGGTCADDLESTNTVGAGTWVLVTAVQTGTTKRLYINGAQDTTKTSGCSLGSSTALFGIGSKYNSSASYFEFFNGKIDDVRLYSRALSSTEISALAAGNHTSATWTGGTSTNYETASNWNINAVPDPYTFVTIGSGTYQPVMTANEAVAGLTINPGSTINFNSYNLSMNDSGTFSNNGTLILYGNETLSGFTNDTDSGTVMFTTVSDKTGFNVGNTFNNLILNDGLVGLWKIDESSAGSTVVDASGYGNSGTANGAGGANNLPQPDSSLPPVTFADSHSLNFDGTDDYLAVADNASLDITRITISAWVKPASSVNTNGAPIVCKGTGSGGEVYCLDLPNPNDLTPRFYFYTGGIAKKCDRIICFTVWSLVTCSRYF